MGAVINEYHNNVTTSKHPEPRDTLVMGYLKACE